MRTGPFSTFNSAVIAVHVGSGAGKVVNNALKAFAVHQLSRFIQDGVLGAPTDMPAFMRSNRAKVTFAVTATVGDDGIANGLHGAHFSHGSVIRMHGVFKIRAVNPIQFFGVQGFGRWVLYDVTITRFLFEAFSSAGVIVLIKDIEHFNEFLFVQITGLKTGQLNVVTGWL